MDLPSIAVAVGDRVVNVWLGGEEGGLPFLFHQPTPGIPVPWPGLDRAASDRGLRLLTYARPGYSGSTRHAGRSVADAAGDAAAVLDALGVEVFVALGWSGGGPHALACAALLPDRCSAAASVAGLAPFEADDIDWLADTAEGNVEGTTMALQGEAALRPYLTEEAAQYTEMTSEGISAAMAGFLSEVDHDGLTGEFAKVAATSMRLTASEGVDGWIDDELAFVKTWGFEPDTIEVPVAVWHGRQDRFVPFAHGQWLVDQIPTARARLFDTEGHISLVTTRLGDICADLIDLAEVASN